ncbi:MAG: signal recognition particle-docking protein FtsY [Candidatus Omnitrophica bacterium]|nr:signal recognition particle-docking protein FtsY [Candidatus Omnitrophota bacterium]
MFWKKKQDGVQSVQEAQTAGVEKQDSAPKGLFAKLRDRLKATRESIAQKALNLFRLRGRIDDELLEELEEILISADVGVHTTTELIEELRERIRREKKRGSEDSKWLTDTLRSLMREMLEQGDRTLKTAPEGPSIYLIIGVNGVGKTTAIGKLAHRLKGEGRKILLTAADTFRAAAIDQLDIWSKRADVPIVLGKEGSDPSSVVFNAMEKAKIDPPDVIIIDTAGRLHTKSNLMQELSKMSRVIGREFEGAPHEILLVLDASTGQNALSQARQFLQSCGVTGLILTKLDGTARGGVVLAVHKELNLPVKFIGVGESIEDLEPFDPDAFTKALFQVEGEQDEDEDEK